MGRASPLTGRYAHLLPLLAPPALILTFALGRFTRRDLIGTGLEPLGYGLFAETFPLFAGLVAYGAARIVLAGTTPGNGRVLLRLLTVPAALLILFAASLYPTFGGIVLRVGYMGGGMGFLNGLPLPGAAFLGALLSTLAFVALLTIAEALASVRARFGLRAAGAFLARWLALIPAGLVIASPLLAGRALTGDFPKSALSPTEALAAAACLTMALLPHTLAAYLTRHPEP